MLDLAVLDKPIEPVKLRDGTVHPVRRFNGKMAQVYAKIGQAAGDVDRMVLSYELIRLICPSMTAEQVDDLDVLEVRAITQYAAEAMTTILDAEKNGAGAVAAPAVSAPTTPSAPSSSPSPGPPAAVSGP
jgi:hypothetical protein